jgi:SET domain-containing protein
MRQQDLVQRSAEKRVGARRKKLCKPREDVGLAVLPSNIPGAGKGLFALQSIRKGQILGEYTGEAVNTSRRSRHKVLADGVWLLATSPCELTTLLRTIGAALTCVDSAIDGSTGNSPLIYLNHSDTPNIEFQVDQAGNRKVPYAKATRDIYAGEELFVNYG